MPLLRQSFAYDASKTLPTTNAEDCLRMSSKKTTRRKPPVEDLASVRIFSRNVKALLEAAKTSAPAGERVTQQGIADMAGIALRSLRNQIDGTHAPTLLTVELIAKAFGIEPWQLFVPDFPAELALNPELRQKAKDTVKRYLQSPKQIRDLFEGIAALPGTTSKH